MNLISLMIFIICACEGIIIFFILKYSKKYNLKSGLLKEIFIFIAFMLPVFLVAYFSSENVIEFFYAAMYITFIIVLLLGLLVAIDEKFHTNINLVSIIFCIEWIALFFINMNMNRHLIRSFPHSWIIFMVALIFRKLSNESKKSRKNMLKILTSNVLGVVLTILLFCHYSESYLGISKQVYAVRKHMVQNEKYKIEEIADIDSSANKDEKYFIIFVRMRNGEHFIYHYKDGIVENKRKL